MSATNEKTSSVTPPCPVTGLPILRKWEWTDVPLTDAYKVTLSRLGDKFLLCRHSGYASVDGIGKLGELFSGAVAEWFASGLSFVILLDISGLRGASVSARKSYMQEMERLERLAGLVIFGTTALSRLSFRLAMRLTPLSIPVAMTRDYESATRAAAEMLRTQPGFGKPIRTEDPLGVIRDSGGERLREKNAAPHWRLEEGGYTAEFEIIDGHIIHGISIGTIEEKHVVPLIEIYETLVRNIDASHNGYSFLIGMTRSSGITRRARRIYIQLMKDFYTRHPFDLFVFYGLNRFFRAAVRMSMSLVPFKVRVSRDLSTGLEMIQRAGNGCARSPAEAEGTLLDHTGDFDLRIERYVDELLSYIAGINWEEDGFDSTLKPDARHPFSTVYDAIEIIKQDLDESLRERNEAEAALKASEERYRTILRDIQDGYYEVDLRGSFAFVNEAMARILGFPHNAMIGLNNRDYMDEDNAREVYQMFNDVFRTGRPVESFSWDLRAGDGTVKHVDSSVSLITDSEGKPVGFRGIVRDVSARKKAEEAVIQARDELEKRVRERTAELAEANRQLKEEIDQRKSAEQGALDAKALAEAANRAKSEFLANMSHELRTPLNHIIGFTELVVDKNFGELNETQEDYLDDVLQSSRHLLSLINDILDLSKVEAGKLELEVSRVNLRHLLENSIVMVKEKTLKHGIRLNMDLDGIPDEVAADERKLKQIVYNLLSNAAKFTPDGGGIELCAKCVADNSPDEGDGGHVEVSVRDTGIGIKVDDLERIFHPFEQVESTRSRRHQGTGLGLSLTKTLVELHCGRIWAESDGVGKGSTFYFTLPLKAPSQA